MDLDTYLSHRQKLINRALRRYLPLGKRFPGLIHRAMRYSVLGQGKRIRPILALAACEAVGGKPAQALPAACALELIHAYSLVHDDLPAMDNDDFRRGRPSTHKRFGEAIGVLTGDALLTYAFELLTRGGDGASGRGASAWDASVRLRVIQEVARAIGTEGMVGGQVVDVAAFGANGAGRLRKADRRQGSAKVSPRVIEYINTHKTGALMAACVRVGALLGGASTSEYRRLKAFGDRIGLVFQLVDDLLDRDGAVSLYGEKAVRRRARRLTTEAKAGLKALGHRAEVLKALAEFILTRRS